MGIENRDYMKRPDGDDLPDSDSHSDPTSDSRLADAMSGFFRRRPRFLIYVCIGLAVFVIAAIVVATLKPG
jgi:hypothetical protein